MGTPEEAATALRTMLNLMGIAGEVSSREDAERITLDIAGSETALIVGRKGQTLDALQYLVNKMVSRKLGEEEEGKPIQVDAEGYRERRTATLTEMAQRLAEKARTTGRPVALDPMSAFERRVVHMALAEAEGVTTRSEGEGIYRHLVIHPGAGAPRSAPPDSAE